MIPMRLPAVLIIKVVSPSSGPWGWVVFEILGFCFHNLPPFRLLERHLKYTYSVQRFLLNWTKALHSRCSSYMTIKFQETSQQKKLFLMEVILDHNPFHLVSSKVCSSCIPIYLLESFTEQLVHIALIGWFI